MILTVPFGDDLDFSSVPAAGETIPESSDPAADFLAREQAELGEDLGQELGLDSAAATSPPQVILDEVIWIKFYNIRA